MRVTGGGWSATKIRQSKSSQHHVMYKLATNLQTIQFKCYKKKICTEDILEEITVNSTIKRKKGKNHGESQITVITSQNSSKWS